MDLQTPRVPKGVKAAKWDHVQVTIRQRAPNTPRSEIFCEENSVIFKGKQRYFDKVFGPRKKNQDVLNYLATAILAFKSKSNVCFIGFGHQKSGVSWTLGTNPSSNGLVPCIYRYLRDERIQFEIKAEWVSTTEEKVTHCSPGAFWQKIENRQELKELLQLADPPPHTHLVVWFRLSKSPTTLLAVVDLRKFSEPLARYLRHNADEPAADVEAHDSLISHLVEVIGPRSAITAIGCISDNHQFADTNDTINYALEIAGELPTWAPPRCTFLDFYSPEEPQDEESPVVITPSIFGSELGVETPKATTSPSIDILHENATLCEENSRASSTACNFGSSDPVVYFREIGHFRTNVEYL